LVSEGRLREAAREITLHLRYTGLHRTLNSGYLRRAMLRPLKTVPAGRRLLAPILSRRRVAPVWLTPFSAATLSVDKPQLDPAFELRAGLLGPLTAEDCVIEAWYTSTSMCCALPCRAFCRRPFAGGVARPPC
jgi:hypothetical protein